MTKKSKAACVRKILKLQEAGKIKYQKAGEELAKLIANVPVGEVIETRSGPFQIIDQFSASNSAYKAARIERFVLKPVPRRLSPKQKPSAEPVAVEEEALLP